MNENENDPPVTPEPTWRTADPDTATEPIGRPWTDPDYDRARRIIHEAQGRPEPEQPQPNPVTDSGVHQMPPPAPDTSDRCPTCGGRVPSDHELLTDVLAMLAPAGDQVVRLFYERLFEARPELRELFPEHIEVQEEKLLAAIVALLQLFQAGENEMEQLDSALARYGRSHTRFEPAATIEEYATVKVVLFGVIVDKLGDRITPRHGMALTRAYEYAAGKMLAAQATAKFDGVGKRRRTV